MPLVGYDAEVPNLSEQVCRDIRERELLRPGQRVLVAVSGGLDSMVLLHVLNSVTKDEGWRLTIAHLNHHLRGRSSDADERLVRRIAGKLRLPLIVGHADVKALSRKRKISIEMAAREARHAFLARTARRARIPTIAVAHHADDQVEHFFIRLFRGTGTLALAGMKWSGRSPADPRIQIVRPLLGQAKATLSAFAVANQIAFREDASNAFLEIGRNRLRHELIPLIKKHYQAALTERTLGLMQMVADEAALISEMAARWLEAKGISFPGENEVATNLRSAPFRSLPPAIQRRCLHFQLLQQGLTPHFDLIEWLRLHQDEPVSVSVEPDGSRLKGKLPGATQIVRDSEGRIEVRTRASAEFSAVRKRVKLGEAGRTSFENLAVSWRVLEKKGDSERKKIPGREFFDATEVGEIVSLRHWQAGDRFQPIGMERAVKLQDLFVNQKVPKAKRHSIILATTTKGDIFWVEGFRISERHKLTQRTRYRLEWQWQRA